MLIPKRILEVVSLKVVDLKVDTNLNEDTFKFEMLVDFSGDLYNLVVGFYSIWDKGIFLILEDIFGIKSIAELSQLKPEFWLDVVTYKMNALQHPIAIGSNSKYMYLFNDPQMYSSMTLETIISDFCYDSAEKV